MFYPTLLDMRIMLFRNPGLGEAQPRSPGHFGQGEGGRGKMSFWPIAAAPRLHDFFPRLQFQVYAQTISVVGGKLSAHLAADLGGRAAEARMLLRIYQGLVNRLGRGFEGRGLADGFGFRFSSFRMRKYRPFGKDANPPPQVLSWNPWRKSQKPHPIWVFPRFGPAVFPVGWLKTWSGFP